MSAKDKHYKPRRFREETTDAAENKLKKSRSAEKYMVRPGDEYASQSGSENGDAPKKVKFPSKVNVPAEVTASRPSSSRRRYTAAGDLHKHTSTGADFAEYLPRVDSSDKITAAAAEVKKAPTSVEAEIGEDIAAAEVADTAVKKEEVADALTPEKAADEQTETKPEAIPEAEPEAKPEARPAAESAAETLSDKGSEEAEGAAAEDKPLDDSLDYVLPQKHKKHHHHHSSSHHSSNGVSGEMTDDEEDWDNNPDDYVQAQPKPKRKKSKVSKVLISILCVILALVVAAVSTFFIMREIGRKKMHNYDKIEINAPAKDESGNAIDTIDSTGRVIKYNGVSYAINDNVVSITFIGTDEGTDKNKGKQMGDAIYVLAVDTKTGSTKILGISRDTMADVDVYSDEGKFIDTEKLQMTYAYSFTGVDLTGGENTLTSISRLFYGLPMKDYFAINLSALKTLNDAIGGVTLTSSMTFVSPEDGRTIYEGETVTLHGAEAEKYVRSRDTEVLESNNDRMARQQEYIRAFIASIFPAAKKDISVLTNLYGAIKENSDSSLDITKLTYIASVALSHMKSASDIEYINLTGKVVEGKNAEMYVSNEDAIRTMLDVFYTPMAGTESTEQK